MNRYRVSVEGSYNEVNKAYGMDTYEIEADDFYTTDSALVFTVLPVPSEDDDENDYYEPKMQRVAAFSDWHRVSRVVGE